MSQIKAVIFDWAGTVVDYGCFAPMDAFIQVFAQSGVPITVQEAREPMGLLKRDHIQAILGMNRVRQAWSNRYGQAPGEADLDHLYELFQQTLMKSLDQFTTPLPGVAAVVEKLRGKGLRIGSTTGYTREMMEVVAGGAKRKGYQPDFLITSDEVKQGRPYPYMIYRNLLELEVYPPKAAVKIGDTVADVQEGRNAGVWTVAVIKGSSELGLTLQETKRLPEHELQELMDRARRKFTEAGADYIIETVDELPDVIEAIERSERMVG